MLKFKKELGFAKERQQVNMVGDVCFMQSLISTTNKIIIFIFTKKGIKKKPRLPKTKGHSEERS